MSANDTDLGKRNTCASQYRYETSVAVRISCRMAPLSFMSTVHSVCSWPYFETAGAIG